MEFDKNFNVSVAAQKAAAAVFLAALWAGPAFAYNQPPMNFAMTSFLDGGPVAPGVYLIEYVQYTDAARPAGADGRLVPGGARVSSLVNLHQFFFLSPWKVLGGLAGLDVLLPVVGASGTGSLGAVPITANRPGFGDLILGPALQFNGASLLGRPYHHRVEVDVVLPTGLYDRTKGVNPGANVLTIEPYYAFAWAFAEGWEAGGRLFYATHGENTDTKVRPGRAFHANYAVSRAVAPALRLGVTGYVLKQVTDDKLRGASVPETRESAFAAGPGLAYLGKGAVFILGAPVDLRVRNRLKSARLNLQILHRF